MYDVAIRGATIVDGSGKPSYGADIGVVGDRIATIGRVGPAIREVAAEGLVASPGFVDPHSHSDWTLHSNPLAHSTIRQGVTTEIVGNCGITNAPVSDASASLVRRRMAAHAYGGPIEWRSFGEYLENVAAERHSANLAFFVGHSTVREAAGVGTEAAPSADQVERMQEYVSEAMDAGAVGMSTGLEYSLGVYADTEELCTLNRIVGSFGGIYASHVRNRDSEIFAAIDECLAIGRDGGTPVEISHLNVRHDTNAPDRAWQRAVQMMESARLQGLDVQADTTPFLQGDGIMTGILPKWFLVDGYAQAAASLRDRSVRRALRDDCDRYWRFIHKGQWHRVRLLNSVQYPELNGLRFSDIADILNKDPFDCYFDVLAAAEASMGDLMMIGDLFTDEHMADMISHPLFSLGVDSSSSATDDELARTSPSPLPYSGHIHYLTHHVRERKTLSLEQAINKMSAKPAARFGLSRRGLLREGYFADLVIFDFTTLGSRSSFAEPAVYPDGVKAVLVNGQIVVSDNEHTGARPGRILARTR